MCEVALQRLLFDAIIKLKTVPLFKVHIFQKIINRELKLEIS